MAFVSSGMNYNAGVINQPLMAGAGGVQWTITPEERKNYDNQFQQLNPVAGFLTGNQARVFFLNSNLPPAVLSQIWELADFTGDGKMDKLEFAIAMKLIKLRLKGAMLPLTLPASMKQTSTGFGTGQVMPSYTTPGLGNGSIMTPMAQNTMLPNTGMTSMMQPMQMQGTMPITSKINTTPLSSAPPGPTPVGLAPIGTTYDSSDDWAVPKQTRLKYTQVFNTNDRGKNGFLHGNQSRHLLTSSGLSHMVLADIWNLSDIDKDGKLTREEFILAMHLADIAKSGATLPKILPANLIPPSFRKTLQQPQATSSTAPALLDNQSAATTTSSFVSFEDRRRDNFNKGNLELEKRRQALLDIQRKENERLEQKEREAREKREKERQEQERRKQQELERRMQAQREAEKLREEEHRKAIEQREAAKREMERQRKMEWERIKRQELLQQKTRDQEEATTLHAKTVTYDIEIKSLNEKKEQLTIRVKDLHERERDQRSAIEAIYNNRNIKQMQLQKQQNEIKSISNKLNMELLPEKQFLMQKLSQMKDAQSPVRSLDTKVATDKQSIIELRNQLENTQKTTSNSLQQLEQLNAKLNAYREEIHKHKLSVESMNRTQQDKVRELQEFRRAKESSLQRKNSIDKIKREQRIKAAQSFMTTKPNTQKPQEQNHKQQEEANEQARIDMENNLKQSQLDAFNKAEEEKRKEEVKKKIQEMQKKRLEKAINKPSALPPPAGGNAKPVKLPLLTNNGIKTPPPAIANPPNASPAASSLSKFVAIYAFTARNSDELTIAQDQIILVDTTKGGEPGWYFGTLDGKSGWFPQNYVKECADEPVYAAVNKSPVKKETENSQHQPVTVTKQADRLAVQDNSMLHPSKGSAFSATNHTEAPSPIFGNGLQVSGMRYRALYPWEAKKENHLTFEKDAVIDVTEKQAMWWYGSHNENSGWFPKSYVKEETTPSVETVKKSPTAKRKAPAPPKGSTNKQQASSKPVATNGGLLGNKEEFVSLYPFEGQEDGDLSFAAGETIIIIGRDGDWWKGTCNGRTGIFPANYVAQKEVETKLLPASSSGREIATVIAQYKATGSEQLSLNVGQLVLVKKKNESGWWEGELQVRGKKRQIGWFPANYVKLKTATDAGSSKSTTEAPKNVSQVKVLSSVTAMYDYSAQNDDELTFSRGAEINLIDKSDADWWKGYLKGSDSSTTGLFPSNYVRETSDQSLGSQESISSEERRRQQHIHELIVSEESYLKDLQCADSAFQQPVRKRNILSEQEMNTLFVNWNDLIMCSGRLVKALRVRRKMSGDGNIGAVVTMIGDILCEQIPNFHPYIRFCSCQLNASTLLQEKLDSSPEFKSLVKECESKPQWKGLPVSSYLVKPMQRITKYPLLIEKILKHTDSSHPDHSNLELALERAEEICMQVNEGVREKENADRLEWLQGHVQLDNLKLVFNSKTNCLGQRRYLHCGMLYKNKSNKELVGFLFNDFLLLTTPLQKLTIPINDLIFTSKINLQFRVYKMPIFLNEVLIRLPTDPALSGSEEEPYFHLSHIDRVYVLRAETINERTSWINKTKTAAEYYQATEKKKREKAYQARTQRSTGIGRLMVTIVEGDKLVGTSNDKHDPYCEVTMGVQCHTTKTVQDTLNPKWNASMQFFVKDLSEDVLCISVFQRVMFSPDDFLGRTEIKVADIKRDIEGKGPITKRLLLHEVDSGEVVIKVDLQLFEP